MQSGISNNNVSIKQRSAIASYKRADFSEQDVSMSNRFMMNSKQPSPNKTEQLVLSPTSHTIDNRLPPNLNLDRLPKNPFSNREMTHEPD